MREVSEIDSALPIYKTYDELPIMLSVPKVAAALGISRASAYELAHRKSFPAMLSKQINTNKG